MRLWKVQGRKRNFTLQAPLEDFSCTRREEDSTASCSSTKDAAIVSPLRQRKAFIRSARRCRWENTGVTFRTRNGDGRRVSRGELGQSPPSSSVPRFVLRLDKPLRGQTRGLFKVSDIAKVLVTKGLRCLINWYNTVVTSGQVGVLS